MGFPFYIARRYILSKKSHHAINIISGISVCGVAIATAALVCILSVFNGFQGMIADLFTAIDPQIKVMPAQGKYIDAQSPQILELKANPDVAVATEVIEDNAIAVLYNRQAMVTIKGVDKSFSQLVDIDKIVSGNGYFKLQTDIVDYGVFGMGVLRGRFGIGTEWDSPASIYAPKQGERISLSNPEESFNRDELYNPYVGLEVGQAKYDGNYVITSLRFAQRIFGKEGQITALELKFHDEVNISEAETRIEQQLGNGFIVKNRYEQQEDTFKIMEIEKLISYIFLTFILIVACFNVVSSISMLIIDKKDDVVTLRNLGASDSQIASIFMTEGRLISIIGATIGIVLGVTLCLLQQELGFIKFGDGNGSHIIDSYPVKVSTADIALTFVTVLTVGFLAVWFPVKRLSKQHKLL